MAKVDINKTAEIIKRHEVEPTKLRAIVEELNLLVQREAAEEAPPSVKKQFVILISDPDGKLPEDDFAGWVLQIPETESVVTTQERIFKAVYDYNATKKGRIYPAKTVGEALENVPAKHFKDADVWVKSKIPVLMLRTDNEIPLDESE